MAERGAGQGRRAVFDIIPARVMTAGEMDNVTAGSAAQLQAVSVRLCRTARQVVKNVWIRFYLSLYWFGLVCYELRLLNECKINVFYCWIKRTKAESITETIKRYVQIMEEKKRQKN